MLRTKNLQEYDSNMVDPWSELLSSVAWTIYSTHHMDSYVYTKDNYPIWDE